MFALSVKDIKTILMIEDTEKDAYIETMLPIIISLTEEYCNNSFAVRNNIDKTLIKTQEGYLMTDAGIVLGIAKIIEYYMNKAGVQQNTVSRVSFSFTNDLPKSVLRILNTYRRLRFY